MKRKIATATIRIDNLISDLDLPELINTLEVTLKMFDKDSFDYEEKIEVYVNLE